MIWNPNEVITQGAIVLKATDSQEPEYCIRGTYHGSLFEDDKCISIPEDGNMNYALLDSILLDKTELDIKTLKFDIREAEAHGYVVDVNISLVKDGKIDKDRFPITVRYEQDGKIRSREFDVHTSIHNSPSIFLNSFKARSVSLSDMTYREVPIEGYYVNVKTHVKIKDGPLAIAGKVVATPVALTWDAAMCTLAIGGSVFCPFGEKYPESCITEYPKVIKYFCSPFGEKPVL